MHALSQKLGKNPHYVTQLLNRGSAPSVKTLEPIADLLGMTVTDLIVGPTGDAEARSIAADIERLSPRDRAVVVDLIRSLKQSGDDSANDNHIVSG